MSNQWKFKVAESCSQFTNQICNTPKNAATQEARKYGAWLCVEGGGNIHCVLILIMSIINFPEAPNSTSLGASQKGRIVY